MRATLFAVPASHPSLAAQLMLERKGIEYRRFDFVSGVHRLVVRGLGFPRMTVPAVRMDGARVQGTRNIALALDAVQPEPPLVPRDAEQRDAVMRAESWGDEVLQPAARRVIWASLKRERSTLARYLDGARLGIPAPIAARTAAPVVFLAAHLNRAGDEAIRRDLAALPAMVDRVDELLAAGTIGGPEPNLADFQIGTSVALLLTMEDIRPLIEGRLAARHARAIAPQYPGHQPKALPAAWLPRA
jgi:glutathione S-transferase